MKRNVNGSGLWLRKEWYKTKIRHQGWREDLTSEEFEKKRKRKRRRSELVEE